MIHAMVEISGEAIAAISADGVILAFSAPFATLYAAATGQIPTPMTAAHPTFLAPSRARTSQETHSQVAIDEATYHVAVKKDAYNNAVLKLTLATAETLYAAQPTKATLQDLLGNTELTLETTSAGVITKIQGESLPVFGMPAQMLIGQPLARFLDAETQQLTPPDDRQQKQRIITRLAPPATATWIEDTVSYAEYPLIRHSIRNINAIAELSRQSLIHTHRLEAALLSSGQGLWQWNMQTGEQWWDEQTKKIYGLRPEEIPTKERWMATIHPDDRQKVLEQMGRVSTSEHDAVSTLKIRILWPGAEMRWVFAVGTVLRRDPLGNPVEYVGTVRDITEEQQQLDRIYLNKRRLRLGLQAASLGYWEWNITTGVSKFDTGVMDPHFRDSDNQELDVAALWAMVHPDDIPNLQVPVEACLNGKAQSFHAQYRVRRPDGSVRWLSNHGEVTETDSNGKPVFMVGVMHDITERKEQEINYQSLIDRLQLTTRSLQLGIWDWDLQQDVLSWDPTMHLLFGTSPEAFSGSYQDFYDCIHPEDLPEMEAILRNCIQNKESFNHTFKIIRPSDKAVRWIRARSTILNNADGVATRMLGINFDVTPSITQEREFEEFQRRYKEIYNNTSDAIFLVEVLPNDEFRFVGANRTHLEATGIPPYHMHGSKPHDFLPQDIANHVVHHYQLCARSGTAISYEEDLALNGEKRTWLTNLIPIRNDKGTIYLMAGISRNITYLREAETEVRRSQQKFSSVFSAAADALVIVESDSGIVNDCNEQTIALFGKKSRSEILGRPVHELHPQLTLPANIPYSASTLQECLFARNDDSSFWGNVAYSGFMILGTPFVLIRIADITNQKKLEQELIKAKEEAESGNRVKSSFISGISHELRTPLNSIIGFSQLIQKETTGDAHKFAALVYKSGSHLLGMINDILDISRIEANQMTIVYEEFSLRRTLEDTWDMLRLKALDKGLIFQYSIEEEVPDIVVGDAQRLRQILLNLLSNAIKFTDTGSVKCSVTLVSQNHESAEILCSVEDTGEGIPADKLPVILEPFRQFSTKRTEGTGLGLSITNRLLKAMGSSLAIHSVVNQGSSFSFILNMEYRSGTKNEPTAKQLDEQFPSAVQKWPPVMAPVAIFSADESTKTILKSWLEPLNIPCLAFSRAEEYKGGFYTASIIDLDTPSMAELAQSMSQRHNSRTIGLLNNSATSALQYERQSVHRVIEKPIRARNLFATLADLCGFEFTFSTSTAQPADTTPEVQAVSREFAQLPQTLLEKVREALDFQDPTPLQIVAENTSLSAPQRAAVAHLLNLFRDFELEQILAIETALDDATKSQNNRDSTS